MINGVLEDTHLKSLSLSLTHARAHTLRLLILSYVHSVSDLISHSAALSLYVSLPVMDSVIPESYIIHCFVHPTKPSFCHVLMHFVEIKCSQILVVQKC